MEIIVRLFAAMAQHAGTPRVVLALPAGATVESAVARLREQTPGLPWPAATMLAVNQSYTSPGAALNDGDELAVIPPVSGG